METLVIAEAGSCHDGELDQAHQLIDAARNAGADAVKFQFWSSAARMAKRRKAAEYEAIYSRYQMPESWLEPLQNHAIQRGLVFMCSTYLPEDVERVEPFVQTFKIASFEANDPHLLLAHLPYVSKGKNIIISMGMGATTESISRYLVRPAASAATIDNPIPFVRFLHCVSAYPTPIEQLNLERLRNLDPAVSHMSGRPYFSGFSDHSDPEETMTGALAVAAGAQIIERHFRLPSTRTDNPDCATAMYVADFGEYIDRIRFAEKALYPAVQLSSGGMPAEEAMRRYRLRPEV